MLASRLSGPAAKLRSPPASAHESALAHPLHSGRRTKRRASLHSLEARASNATSESASSSSSSPRPRPPLSLLDQASTPLLDAVLLRGSRTPHEAPFHVPGHKRGAGIVKIGKRGPKRHPLARLLGGDEGGENSNFASVLRHDLTELPGLDLLSQPEGPILEAQRLAAEAWRVSQTRFLVNGSTGGIAAAVLACCRLWRRRPRREQREVVAVEEGGSDEGSDDDSGDDDNNPRLSRPLLLISRGAHRSAAAAAELAGADVVWIEEEREEREREEREGREGGPSDGDDDAPPPSSSFESRWGGEGLGRVVTAQGIRRALDLARELDISDGGGERSRRRGEEQGKRGQNEAARVPAAVLVVSPSYFGSCSDTASLAAACCSGERNIPLIVDQAHGAHFGLDARFPPSAAASASAAAGEGEAAEGSAAVVLAVASAHKTLDALGQSALLHSSSGVPEELQREVDGALAALQSSSPSYLLLASLDAARAAGAKVGGEDSFSPWDEPLRAAAAAAEAVRSVTGAHLLSDEKKTRGKEWDPLRLTVRLEGIGGRALAAALEEGERGEEESCLEATAAVEMSTSRAVVLALGAGSTVEHAEAFGRALERVARSAREGRGGGEEEAVFRAAAASPLPSPPLPGSPSSSRTELIPLRASLGRRLAAALLAPYPPGVPLVLEGEALSSDAIAVAAEAWEGGAAVVGLSSEQKEKEGARRGEPLVRVFCSR